MGVSLYIDERNYINVSTKEKEGVFMYIENFKYYINKAREYNKQNTKNYPSVYYSGDKSGNWGVTFPAPNEEIGHTSTDMKYNQNNRDFATALAMFVEDISQNDPVAYLEWGQKNNLFLRTMTRYNTNALYVRYEYNYGHRYKVCVPRDGFGYEVVPACENTVYYSSIRAAIIGRNRVLELKLNDETLSLNRANAFRRALTIGSFQEFRLLSNEFGYNQKKNIDNFSTILAMFRTYCVDETLVNAATIIYDWLETLGNETNNLEDVIAALYELKEYLETIPLVNNSKEYVDYLIEEASSLNNPHNVITLEVEKLKEVWGCARKNA